MAYYGFETTLTDELISFLFSCRSTSIRKKILWERIQERRKVSKNAYYQSIYRLRKKGIFQDFNDEFVLSNKGKNFFNNSFRKINKKPKNIQKIMIIFDIPESKRKVRTWIRNQIKDWDFEMVQKSVWIGYGPLPDEFTKRLKNLEVSSCVKIFNLQKVNRNTK